LIATNGSSSVVKEWRSSLISSFAQSSVWNSILHRMAAVTCAVYTLLVVVLIMLMAAGDSLCIHIISAASLLHIYVPWMFAMQVCAARGCPNPIVHAGMCITVSCIWSSKQWYALFHI
jgi:hypothetical protein